VGEAKRRGTFEERKKQSQEKYKQYLIDNPPVIRHPKSSKNSIIPLMLGIGAMSGLDRSIMEIIVPKIKKSKIRENKSKLYSIRNLKDDND